MTIGDDVLSENLRAYIDKVEQALASVGVEPIVRHGIIRDLEGQITEMRVEEGMSEDAILESLDTPGAFAETCIGRPADEKPAAEKPATTEKPPDKAPKPDNVLSSIVGSLFGLFYAAVSLLAAAAILIEMIMSMCAQTFFDPIPTYLHLLLLITTPIILSLTCLSLVKKSAARHIGRLFFANGFLVVIGFAYTAVFLPIMPMAFIAIIFGGLGLLPLSPLFVFVASVLQGEQLRRQAKLAGAGGMWKRWLAGFALSAMLLGGWQGYTMLLNKAMIMTTRYGGEKEAGIRRIRLLGGEHYVLANCFHQNLRERGVNTSVQHNRILYYRLTGKDYREAGKPFFYSIPSMESLLSSRSAGRGASVFGEDSETLSLGSAVYDISIAADAEGSNAGPGVAYAELTLEFVNSGTLTEEARCQFIMPPGSVASRLTLWIDGEEREAAFGKKGVVRQAYERVVNRNLDPALLTTAGADRVSLQCFPVLPSETMKVKVGFSLPLSPEKGKAKLRLPYISERNFTLALTKGVSIWAESDAPMSGNEVLRDSLAEIKEGNKSRYAIRRYVTPDDLPNAVVSLPLPTAPVSYRAELSGLSAISSLVQEKAMEQRLIAVVIDVSVSNKAMWKPGSGKAVSWEDVLKNMPEGFRAALFAGEISLPALSAAEAAKKWPEALSRVSYVGADEQAANLEKAWDACDGKPGSAVLWLHGAMPVGIAEEAGLTQRLRRRPPSAGGPTIFSLQMRPGINRLEESLAGLPGFVRLEPVFDETASKRLSDLFACLAYPSLSRQRYVFSLDENETDSGATRYAHVVRLAAAHYVERRLSGGPMDKKDDVVDKALKLRLITSATGAVVLENETQYKQHSLDPNAAQDAVPVIPEPAEWAMLAISAALVGFVYIQRRKREVLI